MKRSDLENLRWKKEKVQLLRSQIAELEEMMECVRTTKYTDMPKAKGGTVDRIAELIDKKDELKRGYVREIAGLMETICEAEAFIGGLTEQQQTMLKLRFFENKTWFEVADIMDYEISTIFRWWRNIVKLID